jgi:drug/metabolite transporter (DMT)-like permease
VRFLFGFPFAILFLIGVFIFSGSALPRPGLNFIPWLLAGALFQIGATATMLAAMGQRSFVVVVAYIKTEPIQVAIFGLIFLGDLVSVPIMAAILIATAGVIVMSFKPGAMSGGMQPTIIGLVSGGMFALSAIGYRGAILSLNHPNFVMAATFTLAVGLVLQAAILTVYLLVRDRAVLSAIMAQWRPSIFAGFMGAFASQFWFLAFAIATAASVRTLALVEVLFAQAISAFIFKQKTSAREGLGMALIVVGVLTLIWAH